MNWMRLSICVSMCDDVRCSPTIPWRPGRIEFETGDKGPQQDNLLPDGSKGPKHIRDVFHRMGFGDREIVALSGAHAVGRCHRYNSGWDGYV
jgi:cytochrome c peroxidase